MRVLFDHGVPVPLRRYLTDHQVETAFERSWSRLRNGELLAMVEKSGFDLFITTDKNLRYQQNITGRRVAIIVLGTTSWPRIERHASAIATAIGNAFHGSFLELDVP